MLAVAAVGDDVADARARAYAGADLITFDGAQRRTDIAAEGVVGAEAARPPHLGVGGSTS